MKLLRRHFLHLVAGATALPGVLRTAWARKAIPRTPYARYRRLTCRSPARASSRAWWLKNCRDNSVNQSSSKTDRAPGGNIATELVVRAPSDGYLLLLYHRRRMPLMRRSTRPYLNYVRDPTAPVAMICTTPFVMVVNPSVPAKTVPEFLAYAKANPGKINMASSGIGTAPHLVGELFKMMTGVDLVHVPYRASSMPDLLAGQVQVTFTGLGLRRSNTSELVNCAPLG